MHHIHARRRHRAEQTVPSRRCFDKVMAAIQQHLNRIPASISRQAMRQAEHSAASQMTYSSPDVLGHRSFPRADHSVPSKHFFPTSLICLVNIQPLYPNPVLPFHLTRSKPSKRWQTAERQRSSAVCTYTIHIKEPDRKYTDSPSVHAQRTDFTVFLLATSSRNRVTLEFASIYYLICRDHSSQSTVIPTIETAT